MSATSKTITEGIAERQRASAADASGNALSNARKLPVKVVEKKLLTQSVLFLALEPLASFHFQRHPGQYLEIVFDGNRRRAFSIANAPGRGQRIELHVRQVNGGEFTRYLFEDINIGAELCIEGPLGTFVPRGNSDRPVIFVAGGTGFAPIKAIIEHFLQSPSSRPMSLYWGVRQTEDLYLHHLPKSWASDHPNFFYTPILSEGDSLLEEFRHGLVHDAVLHDFPNLNAHDVYMSGPPAMMNAAKSGFIDAGLLPERLYSDGLDFAPALLAQVLDRHSSD